MSKKNKAEPITNPAVPVLESQIRDAFRRPSLFFSTPASFEEGVSLLIALRDSFAGYGPSTPSFLEFRDRWVTMHFPETSPLKGLYDLCEGDKRLHYIVFKSLVSQYDLILVGELEE